MGEPRDEVVEDVLHAHGAGAVEVGGAAVADGDAAVEVDGQDRRRGDGAGGLLKDPPAAAAGVGRGGGAAAAARLGDGDIEGGMCAAQSGTSIFDPCLTELAYRWFCPPSGAIPAQPIKRCRQPALTPGQRSASRSAAS